MKRPIIIGLTALTLIGAVGCSAPSNTKIEDNSSNNKIEQSVNEKNNEENSPINNKNYIGKVSGIVGNQVSIKLTNDDLNAIFKATEDESAIYEEGEADSSYNLQEDLDARITDEDLKEEGVDVEEYERQQMEKQKAIFNKVNYDGGDKEFTILAGVPIYSSITGKKVKISDIKKGSIIEFIVDEKTNTLVTVSVLV